MTNAEFRTIAVPKIYFKNDTGYRSFYPGELNSNVLIAIGTSSAKIAAQQSAQIAAHKKYLASVAAAQAEQERQKNLQIQRAMIADAEAQKQYEEQQAANAANPHRRSHVSDRVRSGIGAP